ncbi:invasion associated locus B family protein [Roseibium marinum]|uniref:Invasion protein IalB n=1 Tax=Roseibium marinum TaxID=281252 RepID=A0A2S3V3L2_9HYPH|nr:invasion associated locus B family protein [Roseibium marinum]POF34574.1 invasion protein IalB [Roseibium marinum]
MQFIKSGILLSAAFSLSAVAQSVCAQQAGEDTLWQTRCAGPSRSVEALTCEASESIRMKESGQLVFKVDLIFPANNAAPVFHIQAPLGFYLPGKIKLGVDGKPISELEIGTCDQRGCFLSTEATPEMIATLKAGEALQIDFAPAADRRQTIEMPLTGFSRAMDAVQ